MPAAEEVALYASDRVGWLNYAAPRIKAILEHSSDDALSEIWSRMKRDTQVAVWKLLSVTTQHKLLKRIATQLGSLPDTEVEAKWMHLKHDTQAKVWPLLDAVTQNKLAAKAPGSHTTEGEPNGETL